jgi:aryl-alcohol dehydrogenase-like predicted oxidoreductase
VEHRRLGNSGLRVSRLALGTMSWGVDTDADEAASQLVAFVDAGGTFVDTADVYGEGESERILGGLLGEVVPREDVVLATKAVARRTDGPFGGGASRGALLFALDASLARLGVDHIDLWQLHAWDPSVPIEETLATVDTALASGKVRYAGVSNYTGWQLATAATWQRATPGRTPLIATQVEYSLLERTASACSPGRRWAGACSPASTGAARRPTRGARPSATPPTSNNTAPTGPPGSWRPWSPPPTDSAHRHWR